MQHANIGADLTNFTVLVVATIPTAHIESDYDDLRFYDGSGNLLKHYVVSSATVGSDYVIKAKVKKPSLYTSPSGTDNAIWAYYGYASATNAEDAANTYDANTVAVWDMKGSGTTIADVTGNGHTLTKKASSEPAQGTGKIGACQVFDGSDDYCSLSSLTTGTTYTFSALIYPNSQADGYGTVLTQGGTSGFWMLSSRKMTLYGTGDQLQTTAMTDTAWNYYAASVVSGASFHFLNGSSDGSIAANTNFNAQTIGNDSGSDTFKGSLDNMRLDSTNRSTHWLAFDYRNIFEADNELTWGAEEEQEADEVTATVAIRPDAAASAASAAVEVTASGTIGNQKAVAALAASTEAGATLAAENDGATLAAAASVAITAAAAIETPGPQAAASATVEVTAAAAIVGPGSVALLTTLAPITAGCAIVGPGATVTASATVAVSAAAALDNQKAEVASQAAVTITAAAAIETPGPQAAASATVEVTAAAAIVGPGSVALLTTLAPITAGCAIVGPGATVTASATVAVSASASLVGGQSEVAGQAAVAITAAVAIHPTRPTVASMVAAAIVAAECRIVGPGAEAVLEASAVNIVPGPYRVARGQIFRTGAIAGDLFIAGAVAGQTFRSGARAGDVIP